MNIVILIGRLTKDPELQYTANTQTAVCRMTLAVDRPKHNGDAQGADYVRSADFIRVTVWGRQAETCDRYLSKGRRVSIQGRIQTGSYKDRNGETVYTTDVVADRVEFLGGDQQQTQPRPSIEQATKEAKEILMPDDMPDEFEATDDDVPF